MKNWNRFWQSFRSPPIESDDDLLRQVGTTISGKAISKEILSLIVSGIRQNLAPRPTDVLLDLCCGNGVLTFPLASSFKRTIGVDFSVPNIENARKYKQDESVQYLLHDASDLASLGLPVVDKVLMYGCLMYFSDAQFTKILADLRRIGSESLLVYGGSVLDKTRTGNFFNTPARKARHLLMRLSGEDGGLGRWWHPDEVVAIARSAGYDCEIMAEAPEVHTAHYRFDFLLRRSRPLDRASQAAIPSDA